jgi:hypothetical protein
VGESITILLSSSNLLAYCTNPSLSVKSDYDHHHHQSSSSSIIIMGKNNKNNKKKRSLTSSAAPEMKKTNNNNNNNNNNPLLTRQETFFKGLTNETERNEFFSPQIPSERRAELWMQQADLGEKLVNKYAWATPNPSAIRILKEFSPLVEIGCGANAYWCKIMRQQAGIDMIAYDTNIQSGGSIIPSSQQKKKTKTNGAESSSTPSSFLRQGGPEVLSSKQIRNSNRTLFLCYPDEEREDEDEEGEDEDEEEPVLSMGASCLEHFQGTYVIHVGELFLDANLSLDQAPWGRSSSPEFQERLASEYHCLLKVQLPNWLHVRDSISVWKRSETSTIVFAADEEDDDDEEDEEVEYRHIPMEERLPMDLAAPCLAHLLLPTATTSSSSSSSTQGPAAAKKAKISSSPSSEKTTSNSSSSTQGHAAAKKAKLSSSPSSEKSRAQNKKEANGDDEHAQRAERLNNEKSPTSTGTSKQRKKSKKQTKPTPGKSSSIEEDWLEAAAPKRAAKDGEHVTPW